MVSNDVARRREGSGSLAKAGPMPDPGHGSDITGVSFTARAITYDDGIPTTFRTGARAAGTALVPAKRSGNGPGSALVKASTVIAPRSTQDVERIAKQVIASGARQLDGARRSGDRLVQRRVGWQATPTLIVVTTAERELNPREDRRLAPSGPWQVEHRLTYPCTTGAATKRVGTVPFDSTPDPETATSGAQRPAAAFSAPSGHSDTEKFPEGAQALSFLPSSVRASILARVPAPTVFDGTVLQFTEAASGKVVRQEVNVIRMDAATAVVVQARRDPAATAWEVSQAVYALGEPEVEQV